MQSKVVFEPATKITNLIDEMVKVAREEWSIQEVALEAGQASTADVVASSQRLLTAELARASNDKERVEAWTAQVKRISALHAQALLNFEAGRAEKRALLRVKFHLLEAQLGLERARERSKGR